MMARARVDFPARFPNDAECLTGGPDQTDLVHGLEFKRFCPGPGIFGNDVEFHFQVRDLQDQFSVVHVDSLTSAQTPVCDRLSIDRYSRFNGRHL